MICPRRERTFGSFSTSLHLASAIRRWFHCNDPSAACDNPPCNVCKASVTSARLPHAANKVPNPAVRIQLYYCRIANFCCNSSRSLAVRELMPTISIFWLLISITRGSRKCFTWTLLTLLTTVGRTFWYNSLFIAIPKEKGSGAITDWLEATSS